MLSPHITAAGIFVPIMLWSPAALPAGAKEPSAAPRPNIVLILADDMGYADAGVHGCKDIPTPHIDSIARGGIRFSDAYANAAVCSPTRAALMSGMYQQRHGNEDLAEITGPLPRQVTTLPQRLRAAGYATALIGKWHLGQDEGFTPLDRGFDRFFGFLGGGHFYFPEGKPKTKDMDETMLRHIDNYSAPLLRDREPLKERRYLTDAFAGESAAYIASRRDNPQPFFLLTAFNAVHTPMEATQKYLDRFPDIADPKRRTYAGMLSAMDDAVGEIISALKACGQLENTLLIFTNDNGGASVNASKNAPLRGWKAGMFEGGLRVPLLMQWPGVIEPGSVYSHPVMTFDVTSTVLAAAGADQGGLDGVDLLPCLAGNRAPHETLFWRCRTRKTHAVRHAEWKLVYSGEESGTALKPPAREMLFNLKDDIGEKNDLAEKYPEKLAELEKLFAAWSDEVDADCQKLGSPGRGVTAD